MSISKKRKSKKEPRYIVDGSMYADWFIDSSGQTVYPVESKVAVEDGVLNTAMYYPAKLGPFHNKKDLKFEMDYFKKLIIFRRDFINLLPSVDAQEECSIEKYNQNINGCEIGNYGTWGEKEFKILNGSWTKDEEKYLNDTIVSSMISVLIAKRYSLKKGDSLDDLPVMFVDSLTMTSLINNENTRNRWLSKIMKKLKIRATESPLQFVIGIVNLGFHWTSFKISGTDITYIDSMQKGSGSRASSKVVEVLHEIASALFSIKKFTMVYPTKMLSKASQSDSFTCGYHAIWSSFVMLNELEHHLSPEYFMLLASGDIVHDARRWIMREALAAPKIRVHLIDVSSQFNEKLMCKNLQDGTVKILHRYWYVRGENWIGITRVISSHARSECFNFMYHAINDVILQPAGSFKLNVIVQNYSAYLFFSSDSKALKDNLVASAGPPDDILLLLDEESVSSRQREIITVD